MGRKRLSGKARSEHQRLRDRQTSGWVKPASGLGGCADERWKVERRNFKLLVHHGPAGHVHTVRQRLAASDTPPVRMARKNLQLAFRTMTNNGWRFGCECGVQVWVTHLCTLDR